MCATSLGPARATSIGPPSATVLVLGHGAGGGTDSLDLRLVTRAVVDAGYRVVLIDQPWRVAGRRIAPRPAALDVAWLEVVQRLKATRLVLGGRSAGARVACRTAGALGADGVVALAFPLHPPGRPQASRASELSAVQAPVLVIQGERDPFGSPRDIAQAVPAARVVSVPGADHSLRCSGGEEVTAVRLGLAADAVVGFLEIVSLQGGRELPGGRR